MDDSNIPAKRVIHSYFTSGAGHEVTPSDKSKSKKQKLSPPSNNSTGVTGTSTVTTPTPIRSVNTLDAFLKPNPTPVLSSQPAKLFHIFEAPQSKGITKRSSPPQEAKTQARKPLPDPVTKEKQTAHQHVNQPLDQVNDRSTRRRSPPSDSSVSAFTIIKSMNNIRVSDPDSIPAPRKASQWTTPSRSSPRPLTPMNQTPMDLDFGEDNYFSNKSEPTQSKRQTMLPWPDNAIFMGGHIRQFSHDECVNDPSNSFLHHRSPVFANDQLEQLVEMEGAAYLKSLHQQRQIKMSSPSSQTGIQSDNTNSPTMLSNLRISSPSLSLSSSSTTAKQLDTIDRSNLTRHDIEQKMGSLYPLDAGNGWRYPACEGILDRYSNGEWTRTDQNVNWCDKYRPNKVEHLLDNQSHHCYVRDWLERHKVAPSKTDPSFFAPRKKVTRRDMEKHYANDLDNDLNKHYGGGGDDEDDDFMPTSSSIKKKKATGKRNNKDLNMILLVGPHGVGKTAGVFTAAQETGYQVFEIHPGIKRSLKEVHRLVGDMTRNHLVCFQNDEGGSKLLSNSFGAGDSGDGSNSDVDMDDDTDSQQTSKPNQLLTSFFTSKSATARRKQPAPLVPKQDQTLQQCGPKQSLILLEEVDLVYQSDKGFWNGVADLARASKRPIILTCNDVSVIPFDILQLQAVIYYEAPLGQLLLPFLHLISLIEGYDISVPELTTLLNLIGPDIRQLLMTLEYLHHHQRPLLLDNQSNESPRSYNSNDDTENNKNAMLQCHMDLLMNQVKCCTLQQQQQQRPWRHISDRIPGAQMTPLCIQLVENDYSTSQPKITDDDNDDDQLLDQLVSWMDNRSIIDYSVGMNESKISQVYGLDEYGPNDDQTVGYLHCWKKSNDWDHCDMQAYMESSLLEMNHPQKGSGLIDIMSWELICDQRDKQKEEDLDSVEHILNCRTSMALGSVGFSDISYSKHIEQLRQMYTRRRRRTRRRAI